MVGGERGILKKTARGFSVRVAGESLYQPPRLFPPMDANCPLDSGEIGLILVWGRQKERRVRSQLKHSAPLGLDTHRLTTQLQAHVGRDPCRGLYLDYPMAVHFNVEVWSTCEAKAPRVDGRLARDHSRFVFVNEPLEPGKVGHYQRI